MVALPRSPLAIDRDPKPDYFQTHFRTK